MFEKEEFQLSSTEFKKREKAKTETVGTFNYSATIMKRKWHGIRYAHSLEWRTPLGDTINGSVLINWRLAIGELYATKTWMQRTSS